jgi:class 3 adenylate cyclase
VSDTTSNLAQKTVLFADVSGSTKLYETLGDQRAFAAINNCLEVLRQIAAEHQGQVVKTIGDEIMCVFMDAVTAAQAACEMQTIISVNPPTTSVPIGIRIGFHFGPVLEKDGDIYGDTANMAARMAEIANAGQIITTGATVATLPAIMRASTRALSSLSVKGKVEDIEVCEVLWEESADMTIMARSTFSGKPTEPILMLVHQGRKYFVSQAHPSITIGRDEKAGIVVADPHASRMHAKVERRRDKFMLIDMSSNGSYVTIKSEAEIQLRREEMVLREKGSICLGHPCKQDSQEIVEFSVLPSPA